MKDKSESRSWCTSSSVRITETQDGAVVLDVEQGLCFSVNSIGVLIWTRLVNGCELEQIAQHIAAVFKISLEQARNDTEEFLQVLFEKQLVRRDRKETANGRHRWFAETFPRLWKRLSTNRTEQLE